MSLIFVLVSLTEPCCKCRWFCICIEMGNISERAHTESSNSLSSLLCHQSSNRRRSRTCTMPQHHRRNIQQMAEQHAFQSKMAEQDNGIIICLHSFIIPFLPLISMLCQQFIKLTDHIVVLFFYMAFLQSFIFKPMVTLEESFIPHPVLWKPVPGDHLLFCHIWTPDAAWKFLQPVTHFGTPAHFL